MQWQFLSDPCTSDNIYHVFAVYLEADRWAWSVLCVPCSACIPFREAKISSLFCNYVWFLAGFWFSFSFNPWNRKWNGVEDTLDAGGMDLLSFGKNSQFYIVNCNKFSGTDELLILSSVPREGAEAISLCLDFQGWCGSEKGTRLFLKRGVAQSRLRFSGGLFALSCQQMWKYLKSSCLFVASPKTASCNSGSSHWKELKSHSHPPCPVEGKPFCNWHWIIKQTSAQERLLCVWAEEQH